MDLDNNNVSLVQVTPELAECWLIASKYQGQRKIMPKVVERYAAEMERGEWGLSEGMIVIGIRPNGEHILNGQHRLSALVKANKTVSFIVQRRIFNSDAEMDIAYSLMDRHAKRTTSCAFSAMGLAEEIGVSNNFITHADGALRSVLNGFKYDKTRDVLSAPQTKAKVMRNWSTPMFAYYHSILGSSVRQFGYFLRVPVIAVALVTFRYSPDHAPLFWSRIALNDGLIRGSAEHALYNFLTENFVVSREYFAYSKAVALCWNAYREGQPITRLNIQIAKPITIIDTPWNGKDVVDCAKVVGL